MRSLCVYAEKIHFVSFIGWFHILANKSMVRQADHFALLTKKKTPSKHWSPIRSSSFVPPIRTNILSVSSKMTAHLSHTKTYPFTWIQVRVRYRADDPRAHAHQPDMLHDKITWLLFIFSMEHRIWISSLFLSLSFIVPNLDCFYIYKSRPVV